MLISHPPGDVTPWRNVSVRDVLKLLVFPVLLLSVWANNRVMMMTTLSLSFPSLSCCALLVWSSSECWNLIGMYSQSKLSLQPWFSLVVTSTTNNFSSQFFCFNSALFHFPHSACCYQSCGPSALCSFTLGSRVIYFLGLILWNGPGQQEQIS